MLGHIYLSEVPVKSHQRLIDAKPFFVNWTPSELLHGSPLPIMKCKMNLERLPPLSRRRYRIVQHQFRKTLSKNWGTIRHHWVLHIWRVPVGITPVCWKPCFRKPFVFGSHFNSCLLVTPGRTIFAPGIKPIFLSVEWC